MDITHKQVQINFDCIHTCTCTMLFFKNELLHKLNIHVVFLCTQNFK